ncbi:unnamed protein product [Leuciscus chuanchicus]
MTENLYKRRKRTNEEIEDIFINSDEEILDSEAESDSDEDLPPNLEALDNIADEETTPVPNEAEEVNSLLWKATNLFNPPGPGNFDNQLCGVQNPPESPRDLCVDESLMKWKGRLAFRQFIPSKRHRFRVKFFVLCDVLTGYVEDMIIYTGSTTDIQHYPGLGISGPPNWYGSHREAGSRHWAAKMKQVCVLEYNKKMGAVDKADMMTGFHECARKSTKTNLMRGLLEEYSTLRCPAKGGRPALDTPLRLTARHFPSEVPQTTSQGSKTRRHCKVCLSSTRKERRLTKHMCVPCNTPLCAVPCFEEYHTLKNY